MQNWSIKAPLEDAIGCFTIRVAYSYCRLGSWARRRTCAGVNVLVLKQNAVPAFGHLKRYAFACVRRPGGFSDAPSSSIRDKPFIGQRSQEVVIDIGIGIWRGIKRGILLLRSPIGLQYQIRVQLSEAATERSVHCLGIHINSHQNV